MNKILSALLLLFCFASCAKDDIPHYDELVGTVWTENVKNGSYTLYFSINHKCTYEWAPKGFKKISSDFRYSIKNNQLQLKTTWDNAGLVDFENEVIDISINGTPHLFKKIR